MQENTGIIGGIIFNVSDDRFTKLFKYMTDRFDGLEAKIDNKASQDSLDRLTAKIDSF